MNVTVVLSSQAKEVYEYLFLISPISKRERMLLSAIFNKTECMKQNIHYGNPIAKKLIPLEYTIKYNITNLFRVELPLFWRLLYSLQHDDDSKIVFVVDILDHKDYNKKFGYRNH